MAGDAFANGSPRQRGSIPASRLTDWIAELKPTPGELASSIRCHRPTVRRGFAEYMSNIKTFAACWWDFPSTKPFCRPSLTGFTAAPLPGYQRCRRLQRSWGWRFPLSTNLAVRQGYRPLRRHTGKPRLGRSERANCGMSKKIDAFHPRQRSLCQAVGRVRWNGRRSDAALIFRLAMMRREPSTTFRSV